MTDPDDKEPPRIELRPTKWRSDRNDPIEHLIDLAVAIGGIALTVWVVRSGFQDGLAEWLRQSY
ncbi:MAG: hypothetical protein JJ864_08490 [Rhizobiaceae bacterium]|nr:hypothetical protein [Rhizobiaceae bacterium]